MIVFQLQALESPKIRGKTTSVSMASASPQKLRLWNMIFQMQKLPA